MHSLGSCLIFASKLGLQLPCPVVPGEVDGLVTAAVNWAAAWESTRVYNQISDKPRSLSPFNGQLCCEWPREVCCGCSLCLVLRQKIALVSLLAYFYICYPYFRFVLTAALFCFAKSTWDWDGDICLLRQIWKLRC